MGYLSSPSLFSRINTTYAKFLLIIILDSSVVILVPPAIPVSPLCHSRKSGNPVFLSGSRIKCGMTGGAGSPIRSASLSVEDDKECVIPVKTGIQAGLDPASSAG